MDGWMDGWMDGCPERDTFTNRACGKPLTCPIFLSHVAHHLLPCRKFRDSVRFFPIYTSVLLFVFLKWIRLCFDVKIHIVYSLTGLL